MAATTSNVYQFKITLKGTKPPIWRRIQVLEKFSFWDLHVSIQNAMGWTGHHLHQFVIINPLTGINARIGQPDQYFPDTIPERTAKIAEYFVSAKDKAVYEYDFGDGWDHAVVLEKIVPAVAGTEYPQCIAGRLACPPEDCGGVWGYEELKKILADPQHEEHAERMEWLEFQGYDFDPVKFDPKSVMFEDAEDQWDMCQWVCGWQ